MLPLEPPPTWIALLSIFFSLFTTCTIINAMKPTSEGGIATLVKAASAFAIVFILTTIAAMVLLQSPPKHRSPPESTFNSLRKRVNRGPEASKGHVFVWREDSTHALLEPYFTSTTKRAEEHTWQDERQGWKKEKKSNKEKEEANIRRLLYRAFASKKNGLLGGRRAVMTEVLEEG